MATPGMTIQGDAKLIAALNTIGAKVFKKHLRRIVRTEATPILQTAKINAKAQTTGKQDSTSTGLLWKSLGTRTALLGTTKVLTDRGFRNVGGGTGMNAAIGPRRGMGRLVLVPERVKKSGRRGSKAKLLQSRFSKVILKATSRKERKAFRMVFRNPTRYAHLVEGGRKEGKTGVVAARPFMLPAFAAHRNVALRKVMRQLEKAVMLEARRSAAA